ncbi:ABC transporter permease [Sutcliffiella halmapala]|uniref:ABC transporter permease n=1 Tax=Sutcliffiella halmapala TaxID=79882 RepID=UPI0009950774|nr:ABC transporter permease [Sutcliffiella halmapala]
MFFTKRVFSMLVTLWIIVTLTFLIMHSIPGDPFSTDAKALPEDVLQNMREKYNLDKPLPVQYILYMKNLLLLDFGPSIQSNRDVNTIISNGFVPSAILGLQSLILAIVVGIALGIIAALHHNRFLDFFSMCIAIIGISVPSFILAPLFIKYIAVEWGLLPVASWGTWQHTILPTVALAVGPVAIIARFVRVSMIEVLNQNYIRTAEAKGLPDFKVIWRHGLRNGLIPVMTFIGPLFASLITGTFVIEKIFAIPGIGRYFVDSIFNRDYTVILGTTIFYSIILIITLFLIDLSYRFIDPRIKIASRED